MTRKTIAILILAGGVTASFLISRFASISDGEGGGFSFSSSGEGNSAFAFSGTDANSPVPVDENITENVVQRYGAEVLRLNPPGTSERSVILPTEDTIETIISDSLLRPLPVTSVSVNDIRTTPLADRNSIVAYLDAVSAAQRERFGSLNDSLITAVARFIDAGTRSPLEMQRNAAAAYVDDLLTMPAPMPFSLFHVELINLWNKRLAVANVILANDDDPFKAVVAVDTLSGLSSEEDRIAELLSATVHGINL